MAGRRDSFAASVFINCPFDNEYWPTSRKRVSGPIAIKRQFAQFVAWLPENCERNGFDRDDLLFIEYVEMARQWIATSNEAV